MKLFLRMMEAPDRTFRLLEEAVRQDPRIRAISLSRNFGPSSCADSALDQRHR